MKTNLLITQTAILLMAGTLLILVGSLIVAAPADFYASNHIELGDNLSLLNELKAPAGLLLAAGLFMVGAIFVRNQAETALWLAALIYLCYAGSRCVSMLFDGVPATGLIQAAALEGIVGMACLTVLLLRRFSAGQAA